MTRRLLVALLGALALAGCGSEGRVEGSANRALGKDLFQQKCGACHVLADAGTSGTVGPDLDEAFAYVRDASLEGQGFEESTLRDVVRGQISYPVVSPVTGEPGMPDIDETLPECTGENEPQGCVEDQGAAADAIASYVASVAGLPVEGGGEDGAIAAKDGKEIFSAAGCGNCHVLAAAGSSGTIGPNLDESRPSVELAVDRVTNGKGAMPPFKDKLNEQQIRAVAEFVARK